MNVKIGREITVQYTLIVVIGILWLLYFVIYYSDYNFSSNTDFMMIMIIIRTFVVVA